MLYHKHGLNGKQELSEGLCKLNIQSIKYKFTFNTGNPTFDNGDIYLLLQQMTFMYIIYVYIHKCTL